MEHTWCEKQEALLIRWAEKAAGYRWLHNHARLFYKRQNDYLSYPSIVIASLTGIGGVAVLNPHADAKTNMKIVFTQYAFAFLNVIGGILTSVSKFSKSLQFSEAHSAMCIQYSKFYRNIDMELSLDRVHRADVIEFVNKARLEYDRLLDEAPDISTVSIRAFNHEFPGRENKPDVCNGLSIIDTGSAPTLSKWISVLTTPKLKSEDNQT